MSGEVFRHFGAQAADYARRSSGFLWAPLRRREIRAVLTLLDPQPGEHVLDAGCGAGLYGLEAKARGAQVRGVDGAAEMVEAACSAGLEAEVFDLASAPPPGGPHDKIVCAGALEFCDDPALVVRNMVDGLTPAGGSLVILLPAACAWGRLYRRFHRGHGLEIKLFTHDDLMSLVPTGAQIGPVRRVAFSWVAKITRR